MEGAGPVDAQIDLAGDAFSAVDDPPLREQDGRTEVDEPLTNACRVFVVLRHRQGFAERVGFKIPVHGGATAEPR